MMHWQNGSMSGWGFALMIAGMAVFVGAVVFGAIAWARFTVVAGSSPVVRPAPELVLAERLASGDIDVDEYERRVTALRTNTPPRSDCLPYTVSRRTQSDHY
jgi:putative membrane protein